MATEGNLQAPTRHALDWQTPSFMTKQPVSQNSNAFLTSATVAAAA